VTKDSITYDAKQIFQAWTKIEEDSELALMFTSIQHFIGNGQGFVNCQCQIKYDSQKRHCVKINVPCQS